MVNKDKTYLRKIYYILVCAISLQACAQQVPDNNMKWIAKYDFLDLYQRKVNNGSFNPGSAISIEKVAVPNDSTIILGAVKDQSSFDGNPNSPSMTALFVSNDKGKSYQEVIIGDENIRQLEARGEFTFLETLFIDKPFIRKIRIYILNNTTLELKKVIDRIEEGISYNYFTGKYLLESTDSTEKLINVHNLKEEYNLPTEKLGNGIFQLEDGKLIYQNGQQILEYNALTKESKVLSELKNTYDYFFYLDGHLTLQKLESKEKDDEHYGIYDIYEEKLYVESNDCDYRKLGARPELRYSYDRGKTWKTHHVIGFTILQNKFGFYKDEFLVVEGVFWRGDSPESGGRIMVGEFVK